MASRQFRQNLFEIDNARNLNRDELVATFVPTKAFWRLLSAKHHVILGSRGSGKTAIAKMLSHDHLARLGEKRTQTIIADKAFIGIYVPTELEWVGGLKNKPWQTEREKEEFFQWRLNLSTCLALLRTLRSCLETYLEDKGKRASLETTLATEIGRSWFEQNVVFETLGSLQKLLQDVEHSKQLQLARMRALGQPPPLNSEGLLAGIAFGTDLFVPLRAAITLASQVFGFPDYCSWLLCLDEAEFLEPMHHKILNSYLRAYSKNLYFKITTMPYYHHTLETNTSVPLDVGHDFEYVYIDQDPVISAGVKGAEGKTFADTIFRKRAKISGRRYQGVTLEGLLGRSILLEAKSDEWSSRSHNMSLLRKYASRETITRAMRLSKSPAQFMDQIGRKILPALILRDGVKKQRGRGELDLYSGEMMAVRCGDANPRRLIRIFNRFLLEARKKRGINRTKQSLHRISAKEQSRILKSFSASILNPVRSEEQVGPELYEMLEKIGKYMHHALHEIPLSSDQISSITVDLTASPYAPLVRRAVALGLLFPNVSSKNPDQMPLGKSRFHLAYVLAPYFDILPRRGKAVSLAAVFNTDDGKGKSSLDRMQRQFDFVDGSTKA